MRSNLGLFACFINYSCVSCQQYFPQVSLISVNEVLEGCSEESGPSLVDVKDNKSLGKSEQTLRSLWSSFKWMLLLAFTWVLHGSWLDTIWQILQQSEPKKQRFLTFFSLILFILDQESCSNLNAGCTHQCVQGPFGAQCLCPLGYLLANDSKTCEDIDECDAPGFCSQHCHNTRGSFRCWCDKEYMLDTDGKTCKVTGNNWTLKWTNSS